jgi:hypothetical protein
MTGKRCWRYTMIGDWSDASSLSQITEHDQLPDHARGLVDHSLTLLGDLSTMTYALLGDSSITPRPQLEVWFPRLHVKFDSHIVEGSVIFLSPCYKAHTSPSSKFGDYIGTMHLSVHLSIKFPRRFILDPGTTCLRHLLPGLGTKWAHFTLW